jgi:(R,R)-butanediol dehydrogenase/meso-butanediol dehydrogenase/diacetyl reductase
MSASIDPSRQKAAMYYGKEDIRIEEVAEPPVRPGTVKIAPAFNGICGSDLHLYQDGPIPPAPTSDTRIPSRARRWRS